MLIEALYSTLKFTKEDGTATATVKLNKDHEVFRGHFPDNPIMPGVCMIQLIKELTEKALDKELFLSSVSNVKFMAIINPEKNDMLEVVLHITEEDGLAKIKNTISIDDTLALKMNAQFKVLDESSAKPTI